MIVSQYIDYCRLAEYQYCHWHTVNGFISWVILRFPPLFWIISLKKKKQAIWMLSSKADQHDWFVVLILKSQCCLTIVDKVKQHEPPPSHDDSHCDTLSWLVTLVTSHASLCFDATLNNSQSFNKLQRVSAKPTVSLDRDTVPEHADMFLLSCIIRAQGAWTIYRLPPLTILPLEAAHCAPYVAIPYCIMQWYNRLICMLPCRGGNFGLTPMTHFNKSPFLWAF